jgi:predicted HicB family RNase H-like nuclease
MTDKIEAIQTKARTIFAAEKDWSVFFREVLGNDGIVSKMYPEPLDRAEFEKTPAYSDLKRMLEEIRQRNGQRASTEDATRVITVRLPKALHEALKTEAYQRQTSMNQLCITKLLKELENGEAAANGETTDQETPTAEWAGQG